MTEKNSLQQNLESLSTKKHVYATRVSHPHRPAINVLTIFNIKTKDMNDKLKSIDPLDRSQLDELRAKPLKEVIYSTDFPTTVPFHNKLHIHSTIFSYNMHTVY